jgi:hypothetical protein
MSHYQQAFREARLESQMDAGLSRLCSGVPQKNDEGYAHLLKDAPSLESIREFFIDRRNEFEVQQASGKRKERG